MARVLLDINVLSRSDLKRMRLMHLVVSFFLSLILLNQITRLPSYHRPTTLAAQPQPLMCWQQGRGFYRCVD